MAGGNMDVVKNLYESGIVLGWGDCSDCDTCEKVFCLDDLLWRWVKTNKISENLGDEIKRNFVYDNWDTL